MISRQSRGSGSTEQPQTLRPPGVISILEIYTLDEGRARLGWTISALWAAKRRGLRLLSCGKRRFISGAEVRRFLESLSQ